MSRPGTGKMWTVEGDEALEKQNNNKMYGEAEDAASLKEEGLSEEDTKILLEKEFDDYYEDRTHKSAGPVVFLSKCLGMLPVIWTDDDAESDCKVTMILFERSSSLYSVCSELLQPVHVRDVPGLDRRGRHLRVPRGADRGRGVAGQREPQPRQRHRQPEVPGQDDRGHLPGKESIRGDTKQRHESGMGQYFAKIITDGRL